MENRWEPLAAAVKDLMGYNKMLMKKFAGRNVTVSEDGGGHSYFSEGFGLLGHLLNRKPSSSHHYGRQEHP